MSITHLLLSFYPYFTFAIPLSSYDSPSLIGLPRHLRITHDLNTKKTCCWPLSQRFCLYFLHPGKQTASTSLADGIFTLYTESTQRELYLTLPVESFFCLFDEPCPVVRIVWTRYRGSILVSSAARRPRPLHHRRPSLMSRATRSEQSHPLPVQPSADEHEVAGRPRQWSWR
jgi:hypothetical protein